MSSQQPAKDNTNGTFQKVVEHGKWAAGRIKATGAQFYEEHPTLCTSIMVELLAVSALVVRKKMKKLIWWNTVLELTLKGDLTYKTPDPIEELLEPGKKKSFNTIIKSIRAASSDWKIIGIVIRFEPNVMGLAQAEELREEILNFRSKGKKVIAYAEIVGNYMSNGLRDYLIASACDKIYIAPGGKLMTAPISTDAPFLKGTLEKMEMGVEKIRRSNYKNAANIFTEKEFTDEHRKQYQDIIDITNINLCNHIAHTRKFRALKDMPGEVSDLAVFAAGKICEEDRTLEYEDQDPSNIVAWASIGNYKRPSYYFVLRFRCRSEAVFYEATVAVGGNSRGELQDGNTVTATSTYSDTPELQSSNKLNDFQLRVPPEEKEHVFPLPVTCESSVEELFANGPYDSVEATNLGLIDGEKYRDEIYDEILPKELGLDKSKISYLYVHRYYDRVVPKGGKHSIGYIRINGQIIDGESDGDSCGSKTICRALREAEQYKTLLFHVNTPGGSAMASDAIYRQLSKLKEKGVKVVGLMSNVCASGGMYVICPCDRIIASPSTITGSVGVITLKFTTRKTWEKAGITHDSVATNPENATWFHFLDGMNDFERQRVDYHVGALYETFKGLVGKGRKINDENMENIAQGQVWMGSQAIQLGLVDEFGGLLRAIDVVKELGEIAEKDTTELVMLPKKKSFMDMLKGGTPENEDDFSVPRGSVVSRLVDGFSAFVGGLQTPKLIWSGLTMMIPQLSVTSALVQSELFSSPRISRNMYGGDGNYMWCSTSHIVSSTYASGDCNEALASALSMAQSGKETLARVSRLLR